MKSLILKDLYNLSHNAKSMCFILLFFAVFFIPSSGMESYLYICTALCGMMIVTTFSFDERAGWTPYAMIMPVSRRDLVAGKYIALFIFSVIGLLFGMIIRTAGSIIAGFVYPMSIPSSEAPLHIILITALAFSNVFGGLSIPLIFRFGSEKARLLTLVSFFIPAAISYVGYHLLTAAGIPVTDTLMTVFLYCSPLAALVWNYIMYRISCLIFTNQEF